MAIKYEACPSPAFVLDEAKLIKNLELLQEVEQRAEVSIILALKAFSMWKLFPLVRQYLSGATASSLNEARLIYEEMGQKAHTYAPAYIPDEFEDIIRYSSHITFNSRTEYERHRAKVPEEVSIGLRVNPGYSPVETDLYNPAIAGSRLGEWPTAIQEKWPADIKGLHVHTLCESGADHFQLLVKAIENHFGAQLPQLEWVNFGGGHLITRTDYDVELLIQTLKEFKQRYDVEVILEPGSAIAWETGDLISTVLDIIESAGIKTALLDVSFTAHMPDTLEMPYRPQVLGATDAVARKPTYRLGGVSCLAGDFLGEYSFDRELAVGDRVILKDMMHYTMVKTNHFNGVKHPSICKWTVDDQLLVLKTFTFEVYKERLS